MGDMAEDTGIPFLGSQISLISKSGIRYEGVLHTVDMKESSIALQSVRSFGTEGRRADGPQVPPSNETYEFIIFRGEDIQDLTVMSQPTPQQPKSSVPDDPAIISARASTTPGLYGSSFGAPAPAAAPPVYGGQGGLWGPPGAPPAPPAVQQPPPSQYSPYGGPPAPAGPAGPSMGGNMAPNVAPTVNLTPVGQQQGASGPHGGPPGAPNGDIGGSYAHAAGGRGGGMGGPGRGGRGGAPGGGMGGPGRGPMGGPMGGPGRGGGMMAGPAGGRGGPMPGPGGRSGGRGPAPAPAPPVPDEDYNFEEANKHFNKEAALREAEKAVKGHPAAYNKDDFFDMVSCEALDKMAVIDGNQGQHRRNMHEQRAVDIETFGGLGGVRHFHHRGRGGRGRGRGGWQGGGRQGGGGYYNQQGGRGGRGARQ